MGSFYSTSDPCRFSKIGGRKEQQDYCDFLVLEDQNYGCWVVADGLGGHKGGSAAAKLAASSIVQSFASSPIVSAESLKRYLDIAQNKILFAQQSNPSLYSMRTTVVALLLSPTLAVWGYIGDARLYHFHQQNIVSVTSDHSVTQMLVDVGKIKQEDLRFDPNRNRLLRCMGSQNGFAPSITEYQICGGNDDAFLLCTDGFWEHIWENEMEQDLRKASTPNEWLALLEDRLLYRVSGSYDNHSAMAVFKEKLSLE